MKAKLVCWVVMAIMMAACSGGRQSNSSELMQEEVRFEIYQIPDDLLASERELKLSELADSVWYVPLETKPECVLAEKFDHFRYKNHRFYVMDDYAKTVHVFPTRVSSCIASEVKDKGRRSFIGVISWWWTSILFTFSIC